MESPFGTLGIPSRARFVVESLGNSVPWCSDARLQEVWEQTGYNRQNTLQIHWMTPWILFFINPSINDLDTVSLQVHGMTKSASFELTFWSVADTRPACTAFHRLGQRKSREDIDPFGESMNITVCLKRSIPQRSVFFFMRQMKIQKNVCSIVSDKPTWTARAVLTQHRLRWTDIFTSTHSPAVARNATSKGLARFLSLTSLEKLNCKTEYEATHPSSLIEPRNP